MTTEPTSTGEKKPAAAVATAHEPTLFETRRDYLSKSLHVTKADASARIHSLATNYAAKCGLRQEASLEAVLAIDPERLLDLLTQGPAEAAMVLPPPVKAESGEPKAEA